MAYACSWIIIASLELIFPPKNLIKNLLLPQIWGISPVLKIAIAPDLGKISRSKCHLTDKEDSTTKTKNFNVNLSTNPKEYLQREEDATIPIHTPKVTYHS